MACSSAPTVIDLFSGAGGVTVGFRQAGFTPIYAADSWTPAVETYRLNHGGHIEEADLTEDADLPTADVFAGGPPCQGFSSAGRRADDDDRNSLVKVFALFIAHHRPRAFLFENVEGFLTTGGGRFLLDLLGPVVAAGYQVHIRKVNAANFGVPQHRKRILVIGGLGFDPGFPEFTHRAYGAPGSHVAAKGKPRTPTVADAIGDLPAPDDSSPGSPFGHYATPLSATYQEMASLLKPGQCMRDLPEHLWHDSYRRRANRRVADGMPTERRGGAPAGIRRLYPDQPCKAITGAALRDFLHYSENRGLTLRECCRIQTYPDDFVFAGTPLEVVQQIGNSVPPLLAFHIATHIAYRLTEAVPTDEGGRVISFVPTASEGMSPALKGVCDLVAERFDVQPGEKQEPLLWQL